MNNFISDYLANITAIVIAFTIHGFSQAFFTIKLGDDNFKTRKYLTLNPLKHIEFIGFLLAVFCGYGWNAPVEINPYNYIDRKKGTIVACLAPTLISLIIGFFFSIIYFVAIQPSSMPLELQLFFKFLAVANFKLGLFHLLPVYPLNGYRILGVLLSTKGKIELSKNEKIMQVIMILLIFFGFLTPFLNFFVSLLIRM